MNGLHVGEWAAVATALLWTLSTLAWTSAGRRLGALAVSFLRLPIACVFMLLYGGLVRGLWLPSDADARTWLLLGISGFLGFFLCDLCLFKAFLLIGPRLSLLMQSLSPPVAAVLAWLFLDDQLALRHWLAMAVTLAGVAWVVLEEPETDGQSPPRRHWAQGIVLAAVAAVGGAAGLVLSKEAIGQYDAVAATFIRVIGAMAGYPVLITLLGRWPAVLAAGRNLPAMATVTFGALVGPFVGVALCMVALRYCHAGVAATIINTMPVLILPFAILLYRERVSLRAAGGAVVSVAGVALLVL